MKVSGKVAGTIAEVAVIAILGWALVYGPKESQVVVASILGAAVGARVNARSQKGTGLGSVYPEAYEAPVMRAPAPSHTGFTDAPPEVTGEEWAKTVERVKNDAKE